MYKLSFERREISYYEICSLYALILSAPLFEAFKNIAIISFIFLYFYKSVQSKKFGIFHPTSVPIFILILLLWVAPFLSSLEDGAKYVLDAPRWTLIGLVAVFASALEYTKRQLNVILLLFLLGGILAVGDAFWSWSQNNRPYPELRSVGHVNHSSMYTAVVFAVSLGVMFTRNRILIILGLLGVASTLIFAFPAKSTSTFLTISTIFLFFTAFYCWAEFNRFIAVLVVTFTISTLFIWLMLSESNYAFSIVSRFSGSDVFSKRDLILNSALAVWEKNPLFGTGYSSFGEATSADAVQDALSGSGLTYIADDYHHTSHGHNLFTNLLVERGLLGVGSTLILLTQYLMLFGKNIKSLPTLGPDARSETLAGFFIVVGFIVGGIGNTTMQNEHGLAGMLLLSVIYSRLAGKL